jgi:hypothetical protein
MLEPFAPDTLATIRAAFRAGWQELTAGASAGDPILRNRLAGAIANLARAGVDDADELKRKALRRLKARTPLSPSRPTASATGRGPAAVAYCGSVAP